MGKGRCQFSHQQAEICCSQHHSGVFHSFASISPVCTWQVFALCMLYPNMNDLIIYLLFVLFNNLQVKDPVMHSEGADVIQHVIDRFLTQVAQKYIYQKRTSKKNGRVVLNVGNGEKEGRYMKKKLLEAILYNLIDCNLLM